MPGRVQTNRSGRPPLLRCSAPVPVGVCRCGLLRWSQLRPCPVPAPFMPPLFLLFLAPPLFPFPLWPRLLPAQIWRVFRPLLLDVCLVIAARVRCMCAARYAHAGGRLDSA